MSCKFRLAQTCKTVLKIFSKAAQEYKNSKLPDRPKPVLICFVFCISAKSFRGNYFFLNLEIVENSKDSVDSNILPNKLNFAAETIQGRKLFAKIQYVLGGHKDGNTPPSGKIETQCNDMTKEKNLAKKTESNF